MEDHHVHVIPSKTIPQGLCACIMFNPDVDFEMNLTEMSDAISLVKTGQVTYAIKDTMFEGMEIKAGDYMGIMEKDIVVSTKDKMEATKTLIQQLIDDDSEIVTLIYGEGVSDEEAENLTQFVEETYNVEVELTNGKQPVYSYIIGVE